MLAIHPVLERVALRMYYSMILEVDYRGNPVNKYVTMGDFFAGNDDILDPSIFYTCKRGRQAKVQTTIRIRGKLNDFIFASQGVPIVSGKVAEIVEGTAPKSCQFVPCKLVSHDADFFIMNVLNAYDCMDKTRSEIEYDEDGEIVIVGAIAVAPKSYRHPIFRIEGWEPVIVVEEKIKQAFEKAGIRGVDCVPSL